MQKAIDFLDFGQSLEVLSSSSTGAGILLLAPAWLKQFCSADVLGTEATSLLLTQLSYLGCMDGRGFGS